MAEYDVMLVFFYVISVLSLLLSAYMLWYMWSMSPKMDMEIAKKLKELDNDNDI